MSIKWVIIYLALFVVASIGAGFIKGAIQQRKINKEVAKNTPPEEKASGKDNKKSNPSDKNGAVKPADQKSKGNPGKRLEVKKPKRLERPEDK